MSSAYATKFQKMAPTGRIELPKQRFWRPSAVPTCWVDVVWPVGLEPTQNSLWESHSAAELRPHGVPGENWTPVTCLSDRRMNHFATDTYIKFGGTEEIRTPKNPGCKPGALPNKLQPQ